MLHGHPIREARSAINDTETYCNESYCEREWFGGFSHYIVKLIHGLLLFCVGQTTCFSTLIHFKETWLHERRYCIGITDSALTNALFYCSIFVIISNNFPPLSLIQIACRKCGFGFCKKCLPHQVQLSSSQPEPVPVCNKCFQSLQKTSGNQKPASQGSKYDELPENFKK